MSLTDAQKLKITDWIQAGLKLSDIQNRMASELEVRMTYMEVKMLLAELELKPKDQERPKVAAPLGSDPAGPANPVGMAAAESSSPADGLLHPDGMTQDPGSAIGGGKVAVSVDTLTRAGALVSGKVTFSDQKTADWYLDQQGRLGFAPTEKGYRPNQIDLMTFQTELQTQLAKLGY